MRIMSVIGAIALACLCLASPSIAASPADHLTLDLIGHEQLVVAPAADMAAVHVFDFATPLIAVASEVDGMGNGNCFDAIAWVAIDTPDDIRPNRLLPCNPRHYDPGWRVI